MYTQKKYAFSFKCLTAIIHVMKWWWGESKRGRKRKKVSQAGKKGVSASEKVRCRVSRRWNIWVCASMDVGLAN